MQYRVFGRIVRGVFAGSFLAFDDVSGHKVRIRAYPTDAPDLAPLLESVRAEIQFNQPGHPDTDSFFRRVATDTHWIILVEDYAAWAPVKDVYGKRSRLQSRASLAQAMGELGLVLARHWQQGARSIPLVYPANLIASSKGAIRFRFYTSPLEGRVPPAYVPYAAPEEVLSGERTLQSMVFNVGATLYEMLENRLPSLRGGLASWSRWLRFDPPQGRIFHRVVGSPLSWIARSPELRRQSLSQACVYLLERNAPAYPQTILELAEEPTIEFVPVTLSLDWLEQNRSDIVESLLTIQQQLGEWVRPRTTPWDEWYMATLRRIDAEAYYVGQQSRGPIAIHAHVEYDILLVKDLIDYLHHWHQVFRAYQAVTNLGPAELEVANFITGNSFDADFRIKRQKAPTEAEPQPTDGTDDKHEPDATAGLHAFEHILEQQALPESPGPIGRASKRVRESTTRTKGSPLRENLGVKPLQEQVPIQPARGGD